MRPAPCLGSCVRVRPARFAAEGVRRRIVVTGNPGPAGLAHQGSEPEPVGIEERGRPLVAVEAVAQRNEFGCAGTGDVGLETPEGQAGVVGWQKAAAPGVGAQLFEMEVGDQQGPLGFPPEGAGG